MDDLGEVNLSGIKRKRIDEAAICIQKLKHHHAPNAQHIANLEQEIHASQRHWNNIAILIDLARQEQASKRAVLPATTALCHVFSRFFMEGRLGNTKGPSARNRDQYELKRWLQDRLEDYLRVLWKLMKENTEDYQSLGMALTMELASRQLQNDSPDGSGSRTVFGQLVRLVLRHRSQERLCDQFVDVYVQQFDDVSTLR